MYMYMCTHIMYVYIILYIIIYILYCVLLYDYSSITVKLQYPGVICGDASETGRSITCTTFFIFIASIDFRFQSSLLVVVEKRKQLRLVAPPTKVLGILKQTV